MRANAVRKEPEIQQFWTDLQIYETLADTNPGKPFVLHDGPPYANGDIHMGHTLNKILKDTINKYQMLKGRKVRYVPGWDCHGLPIELKVLQSMTAEQRQQLTPLKLRYKARDFAKKAIARQKAGFQRLGIWGDWEHPYLTLQPEYEAAQIEVFGQMALKGYIYRGLKAVHWSPSSQTALAEAELEYPGGHISRSIYVAFPIQSLQPEAAAYLADYMPDLRVAIWTTTPWTIPGNLALCFNGELTYAVVESETFGNLIVAADLREALEQKLGESLEVKVTFPGKVMDRSEGQHPLYDRPSLCVLGDYVTTESGTGIVHTAPGHGQDDFNTGQKYGLEILSPVDAQGKFTAEAGERFVGLDVLSKDKATSGNQAAIEALSEAGALMKQEPYGHKYPYDWRTKQPTIFRATTQWFASVEGFRDAALRAIKQVKWFPAIGENRITAMVGDRSDWCISRQRAWGVPIPVFYDAETGEALLNEETIAHVRDIFREQGSDAWWKLSVAALLPEQYRNTDRTYIKGTDTMDVWFDSGSSWAAVAERRPELHYPVELYLEGSDQHRGWFQSSLLTSVAVHGCAPYQSVLTHGFVLDEKGQKMSKSLGNVVDPLVIINGGKNLKQEPAYGADVLRLWVSSVDYSGDVPIGKTIIGQMADVYRKVRNTARFLLGNLADFDPARDAVAYEDLSELDRYILHRHREVCLEITDAFETYQFFRFFQAVQNFCVVDLSNFYLDIGKDRLYISHATASRRRQCQTVLALILENLAKAIAPVLSHMAEDIWSHLPYAIEAQSVFQAGWLNLPKQWHQPDLAEDWVLLRQVRDEVNKALEVARTEKRIGASAEAKVVLAVGDFHLYELLSERADFLRYLSISSQVELRQGGKGIAVEIQPAEGTKCLRCWNYSTQVGHFEAHPELCERCVSALAGEF
ncbi:isoleucine--tRNA ligase [Synechococcus sp. PCC 7336]|uniref:isoleucine--tRNA ligase n=1 Tax=Synechococcus sp. PCC 7336 TaxID=195250 RepID=UPI000685A39A|nr:isoleucine--tRNA ligase [Synechococcus sp. PCC 7336]